MNPMDMKVKHVCFIEEDKAKKEFFMPADYIKLITSATAELPADKQLEVYDFVQSVRCRYKKSPKSAKVSKIQTKDSLLGIIGIGDSGRSDIAANHDKFLYDD